MTKFRKIIFLDEEGTELSPYAEVLLKQMMKDRGIEGIEVESRGNIVLFPEPANQKIAELVRRKGLSLDEYTATALQDTEFSESTLILTFSADSKQKVYDSFPGAVNVYMMREFVGETGDIVLPVGGSIEEYNAVCAVVDRVADRLLEQLTHPEEPV